MRITWSVVMICALSSSIVDAFMTPSQSSSNINRVAFTTSSPKILPSLLILRAEEQEEEGQEELSSESEVVQEEEEESEKKEDPEVVALKEEIASLEKKLSEKRLEKNTLDRLIDNYSENGYARKVAEMENVRKLRSMAFNDNKFTAKANVVQSFLPVLDALNQADAQYQTSNFASKYSALRGNFNTALKELDVTEYTTNVGDMVDKARVQVTDELYSQDYQKGTVIRPVSVGFEIKGNVMRMAQCVASLGTENDDAKDEDDDNHDAVAESEGDEPSSGSEESFA